MFRSNSLVYLGLLTAAAASVHLVMGRADTACGPTRPDVRVLGPGPAAVPEWTTSVAWEPGGRLVATGHRDGSVRLWEADGTSAGRWAALDVPVNAVCFVGNHSSLLTAGSDGAIRLWTVSGPRPAIRAQVRGPDRAVSAAASPDGTTLAVGHVGAISVWRVGPGQLTPAGRLDTPPYPNGALAFGPDGRTLAAGNCGDGSVRLWHLGDPSGPERLDASEEYQVRGLGFSADGRALSVLDTDGNVICWDLGDGPRATARLGLPPVRGGAFAPDGRRVLVAHLGGVARIADVPEHATPFRVRTGTRE